jgi:AcrR family transcriptional regulator
MITPTHDLMLRVRDAFMDHGYDALTMVELAQACAFTRRALYHYFNSKEAAYRAVIRHFNAVAVANGLEAGSAVRRQGGGALDILAETLDVRYGDTRRNLNTSAHIVELNAEAFRRGRDIMIESAIAFHTELERLIGDLVTDGLMTLRPGLSAQTLAQLLTDGARGVNQSLPPIASEDYARRYRQMVEAILYGSAIPHEAGIGGQGTRGQVSSPVDTQPASRRVRR